MSLQVLLTPAPAVPYPSPYPTYTPGGTDDICFNILIPNGVEEFRLLVDDIRPPGGGTRTIGYWANWTTCDGNGSQASKDPDFTNPDVTLLDEILSILDIGIVNFPATVLNPYSGIGCATAVDLLKKQDIGDPGVVGDGSRRANDAAYNMAAQLIAAEANYGANAIQCANASTAISRAQTLLDHALILFDGTGQFLPPRASDGVPLSNYNAVRQYALALAGVLDAYNNIHNAGTCASVPAPPAIVTPLPPLP
jgi:hypothetical protein